MKQNLRKYGSVPLNVCGWLPMIIQLHIGDFGFGHNICGFGASSLIMVLLYAPLWVHTLPLSPFPSQHLDSNNLDDILIYSDTLEEHRRHIREVLLRLWNDKLYTCGDKCSFHEDTVEYLGFMLSPNGLSMDPGKVSTILEWPEPHKVKDIQSFLGFANFYRRFCYKIWEMGWKRTSYETHMRPWG